MKRLLQFWYFPILATIVCACAALKSVYDPNELVRTLDNAIVEIPVVYLKKGNSTSLGGYFKDVKPNFAMISSEKKIPIVIYLHGCAGIRLPALKDMDVKIARITHPSPANPKANRGWKAAHVVENSQHPDPKEGAFRGHPGGLSQTCAGRAEPSAQGALP